MSEFVGELTVGELIAALDAAYDEWLKKQKVS